ncbi:MAG: succinate dehydrogenase [Pirellulales bacterium]|nr:succinate dehydrogenase [Thermoguttaceae bacterium]MDD4786368.1 succinate dehydrogenase [Pirellulales bacterium]MDI9443630.1 succinate dehydrogenase [Planctomycetota bacterium]NLZ02526.1 succinate dehydrogenase [Pirellulaceae bacterium]
MRTLDCASVFGRHEFLIRRLHSLTGLVPIGGYLAFHLATNAAILDGIPAYQHRADQIHRLGPTTILFLEWLLIFLPILFHGIVGMLIVSRGRRNVSQYPYGGNIRYTLQRATGVIAMAFILWHVFQMHGWFRWEWWVESVAKPLGGAGFDPAAAITAPQVIQSSWIIAALYAVGTLACVYHLANGLWTMGITWGVWTSPAAQRKANIPCAIVGFALAVVGIGALYGMWTADLTGESGYKPEARGHQAGAWQPDAGSKWDVPKLELGNEGKLDP